MSTPQQERRLRVFLCHASGDKPAVRDLYHRLRTDGFVPWLDEEELLPGQNWQEEIPAAVRACDIVVVCLSQKSVSKEGYLQKEIREALSVAEEKPEGMIFIIPARLEPVNVPKRLSQWQWANLFQEDGYQRLVRALNLRASAIGVTTAAHMSEAVSAAPVTQVAPSLAAPPAIVRVEQEKPSSKQVFESPPEPPAVAKQNPVAAVSEGHRLWEQKRYWYLAGVLLTLVSFAVFIAVRNDARNDVNAPGTPTPSPVSTFDLSAAAMYQEGDKHYYAKDYQQAREWYEKAAAAGDAQAMFSLGFLYEEGQGVTQNYQEARQWFEKAAAAGSSEAMYNLGVIYENGQGVPQDFRQARQWFEKAAAAGSSEAMYNLGTMYENGQGVPQDFRQARQWYEQATAAGDPDAKKRIEELPK